MKPYGPLMSEHRIIEKMIAPLKKEVERLKKENNINTGFVNTIVDFLRTYADHCHHGKEEDILFKKLLTKKISAQHTKILNNLLDDHKFARKTTKELLEATNKKQVKKVIECIQDLVNLYPEHIRLEDSEFFIPCMQYFTLEEQEEMIHEFWSFDRTLIHEKYNKIIEKL